MYSIPKKLKCKFCEYPEANFLLINSINQVKSTAILSKMSITQEFYRACERGDIDTVKQLIQNEDITSYDVNITSDDIRSGFGKTCEGGHFELAKCILSTPSTSLNAMGLERPIITKSGDEEWLVRLDGYQYTNSNVKEYCTYRVKREKGILSAKILCGGYTTNSFVGTVEDAKRKLSELEIPVRPSARYVLWFVIVFYSMLN